MKQSEAQARATARYERKAYDRIVLRLRKDAPPTKEAIDEAAAAAGESLNAYVKNAILDRMEKGY